MASLDAPPAPPRMGSVIMPLGWLPGIRMLCENAFSTAAEMAAAAFDEPICTGIPPSASSAEAGAMEGAMEGEGHPIDIGL